MPSSPDPTTSALPTLDLDELVTAFLRDGYVIVSGLFTEEEISELEREMIGLQDGLAAGAIDRDEHGGDYLTAVGDGEVAPFVHYVRNVTALSPAAERTFRHPFLAELVQRCLGGAEPWMFDQSFGQRFGVVYQDCRSGSESNYSRIGWHSDHQAFPSSDFWPAVAFTFHIDATSPANGFLRVVPGSHEWSTEGMPLGFEKIRGEIPVYAERGDVILHHCDTWHSAARATEDPPDGVRRHVRGSWYAGRQPAPGEEIEPFNKNARR